MEHILDIYEQPYDPRRPVVCFDERPCQLLGDVLMPIPMKPGHAERQDYQYTRNGTAVVLMAVADWESAALAWVANRNKARLLILRAVSDMVSEQGGEAYDNIEIFHERAKTKS